MIIRSIATFLFILSATVFIWLGFNWITVGSGLNPWIAFPLAGLCFIIPFMVLSYEAEIAGIKLVNYLDSLKQINE